MAAIPRDPKVQMHDASTREWTEILDAVDAARGATGPDGDAAVVVRLPNHQVWSFRLRPMSADDCASR
jgi:hypothetical protein